jgi:hypothetical protein
MFIAKVHVLIDQDHFVFGSLFVGCAQAQGMPAAIGQPDICLPVFAIAAMVQGNVTIAQFHACHRLPHNCYQQLCGQQRIIPT